MSFSAPTKTLTAADILARKGTTPLVCLTAYTTPVAKMADAHCDLIRHRQLIGSCRKGATLPWLSGLQLTCDVVPNAVNI